MTDILLPIAVFLVTFYVAFGAIVLTRWKRRS